jgi:hypothetical protein
MEIEKLTKSIVKPYFTNNIIVSMITSYISIEPDFNNSINVNIKLMLSPKESTLNDINVLELIQWINSFDHIKVLHWDDDKEFDFSNIETIILILKFDYKEYLLKYKNKNLFNEETIKKLIRYGQPDQLTNYFNNVFYNFLTENNIFSCYLNKFAFKVDLFNN